MGVEQEGRGGGGDCGSGAGWRPGGGWWWEGKKLCACILRVSTQPGGTELLVRIWLVLMMGQ